jgi:hypothetical protein
MFWLVTWADPETAPTAATTAAKRSDLVFIVV